MVGRDNNERLMLLCQGIGIGSPDRIIKLNGFHKGSLSEIVMMGVVNLK